MKSLKEVTIYLTEVTPTLQIAGWIIIKLNRIGAGRNTKQFILHSLSFWSYYFLSDFEYCIIIHKNFHITNIYFAFQ